MPKLKCIVIEDEPLAASILSDYISQVSYLKLQEIFEDAVLASEWFRHNDTDLIFLDIHLPKLKGMEFLKTLVNPPKIIITSAYHQYAVEGFNLNVTDYLTKPISFERFSIAVAKVKAFIGESQLAKDHLFLNSERKKIKILFSDILYIESLRDYIKIVTSKREYISRMSTKEIEELLPPNLFKRIHRSFIISLEMIDSYTAEKVDIGNFTLPIGREYKKFTKEI